MVTLVLTVWEVGLGIINEGEKCIITSNVLGKYNSVITYNNVYRKKYSTVVIGLCSNSVPFLIDLLSHEVTLGILLNVFKPQFLCL